jgi:hypothetical protein
VRRLLPLLLVALAGCGSSGSDHAPKTAAAAKATAAPNAARGPFRRVTYMGVSVLVPSGWKRYKPGDTSIKGMIFGPADDKDGSLGFFVSENADSPEEYIDTVIVNPDNDGAVPQVRHRHKVEVPGVGSGIRMQTQDKGSDPQERLFAATIDGLFIELDLLPGRHLSHAQVATIMRSVRGER